MDLTVVLVLGLCLWQIFAVPMVSGNAFFKVEHKFKGGKRSLKQLRAHDYRRHGRMLDSIDLPLGGNALPSDAGLYFTKIQLGNPSKNYHVQVDTGSDILWINCAGCDKCPEKSGLGIKLNLYDPKGSSTAKLVTCDDQKCTMIYQRMLEGCRSEMFCQYEVTYGDGSVTSGYFVQDSFNYNKVSGNQQTATGNSSIVFGCGAKQSGQLSSDDAALDGIFGFGQANSSVISQLAASGKTSKMFSHCLDSVNGGGIFAIGQLVEPKLNTTPMVPDQPHYNVVMKRIEVGGDVVATSTDTSNGGGMAIIDSGTTLAYLPDEVYNAIMTKILAQQPVLQLHTVEDQFKCFQFSGDLDKGFPKVDIQFDKGLTLTVYPHDYLFPFSDYRDKKWCIGWMSSGLQSRDGKDVTILGDFTLANRLVFYDLENQAIGWTPYNCSSTIKVKDGKTGATYTVGAQNISSANSLISGGISLFLLMIIINLLFTIHN